MFKRNKARAIVDCVNCGAWHVIFSMYETGSSTGEGPKKKHVDALNRYMEERRYICGDSIPGSKFHARATSQWNHSTTVMAACEVEGLQPKMFAAFVTRVPILQLQKKLCSAKRAM